MPQVSLVVNVSDLPHSHSNGLSGNWTVPPCAPGEPFALLVIYPTAESQDIGDGRHTLHWPKIKSIARDIVGLNSDAAAHSFGSIGSKEKWGLILCEAEPDMPKSLLAAMEAEIEFLNENPPDVKMRTDPKSGALVATNIESQDVRDMKIKLSYAVRDQRTLFEVECQSLVTKTEIARAKAAMQVEDQRLIAEGDRMWASGRQADKDNINESHRRAVVRLGNERPWCYVPQQLIDCPGCGAKIKENILTCPTCGGHLYEGIEELRVKPAKERALLMYPDRFGPPVDQHGKQKPPHQQPGA